MIKFRGALQGRGEGFPLFADYLARARSRQNLSLQNTTAFGSVHFADLFRSSIHAADRSARWQYSAMLHTATFLQRFYVPICQNPMILLYFFNLKYLKFFPPFLVVLGILQISPPNTLHL